jgi:hypothetical protein
MQHIRLADLTQTFSFLQEEKPSNAWAFPISSGNKPVHGIPGEVLEVLSKEATSWTGWGFDEGKALLLFTSKEDAIFARLRFGEITNV